MPLFIANQFFRVSSPDRHKTSAVSGLFYVASALLLIVSNAFAADDDLPLVPDEFVVDVVAREPMVSNPCVLAFDRRGRLCVAQGPQWRAPDPDTPGDRVDLLLDDDGDGTADRRHTFADGFNSVQGIAWHGDDLWVANAPDLTVVRDTDGDDVADEYVRVYTGLGNLEHSLHGLNFGPDGRLYMSKGNSKGYNRPDQLAPKAFRELWGLESPADAPDYTPIEVTDRAAYRRAYHTPSDDWGQQGGILRCDPYPVARVPDRSRDRMGRNLEIVARGFRNPWDISFDDGFNWLGTDNDQTQGDRIFMPFYGAHFGWGHEWSFHWTGRGHLPTVPVSAPLFEGSGAGLIYYHAEHFPEEYRNVFFVNDWMRREICLFRPEWDGALLKCAGGAPQVFAHAEGGRTLPSSSGRVFEPTDIEVGPDGALYVLSWGHGYGATLQDGQQMDAGRVYRIRHRRRPLTTWSTAHRTKPYSVWPVELLFDDLRSSIPAWRTAAQHELVRRAEVELRKAAVKHPRSAADGLPSSPTALFLLNRLADSNLTTAAETWTLWTLGRIRPGRSTMDARFFDMAARGTASENRRIQALRILAHRLHGRDKLHGSANRLPNGHHPTLRQLLRADKPRLRHEVVQLLGRTGGHLWISDLLDLATRETDRITFYAVWNALRELAPPEDRRNWLNDDRPGVQLAALLGLFEDDEVTPEQVLPLRNSPHKPVSELVELWLQETGAARPLVTLIPPPDEYREPVTVTLETSVPNARLNYTLDGSVPSNTSARYTGPIRIEKSTKLRVAVTQDLLQSGRIITAEYRIRPAATYRHRTFITDIQSKKPSRYEVDWTGMAPGKHHYTDRNYQVVDVPPALRGLPFLRTCNNHDRETGTDFLSFTSDVDVRVLLAVDVRINAPLEWMKTGLADGFTDTGLQIRTTDPTFRVFEKVYRAGQIKLGGNVNAPGTDSRRGNYIVLFEPLLLSQPPSRPVTHTEVAAALATADPQRGRELFLHPKGAGCAKCHQMEGLGVRFGPDLSDIGSRARTADVLIQSILEPSAVITEGYAVQQVVTTKGKSFAGSVLEETGRTLKLVDSNARVTEIHKADIEERRGTNLSPMPAGYHKILNASQLADIVAWLSNQKTVGDPQGFSFHDRDDQLHINFGKQRIATYLKRHDKLTRRSLVNVTTPGGIQVTRNFPPRAPKDIDPGYRGEGGIIHPHMHPGIWISFGDVNGNDYWRLQAPVLFDGFVDPPSGNRQEGRFAVRNLFLPEGASNELAASPGDGPATVPRAKNQRGVPVLEQITRYHFRRVPEGLLLRIDAEYKSDDHDFYFGDQEESGLAVRVASPIRVQGGNGTILNDRGDRNGSEVWGKPAMWYDYFGTIDERLVGVMVAASPDNPRPSWLHARDYGVIVTNPFPKQPKERRAPYVKTHVRRGQTFRLRWAMLIHDQPADRPFDRNAAAALLQESFRP